MTTAPSLSLAAMSTPEILSSPSAKDAVALRAARGACEIRLVADRVPSLRTGSTHKVYRDWRFAVVMQRGQPEQGSTLFTVPIDPARLAASRSRYALVQLVTPGAVATEDPVAFAWSASSIGTANPFAEALALAQREVEAAGWKPDAADPTRYAKTEPTLPIGEESVLPASVSAAPVLTTLSPDEEPGLDGWAMDGGACATVSERSPTPGPGERP